MAHPLGFGYMRLLLTVCLSLLSCRAAEPEAIAPPENSAPPQVVWKSTDVSKSTVVTPSEKGIHGRLTSVGGQKVLHVWGTPQQMGYAHGALLRTNILEVLEDYALQVLPASALNTASLVYGTVADISPELREEALGIVEGMKSAGGATVPSLGRELTATDLLLVNAMTDLLSIGCSSISAWRGATDGDPELKGKLAVVRNLDWSDAAALLDNQIVIAYEPSDPKRQRVVSVAFAGYIGCLSCINEAGVTALFNMGYGDGAADLGTMMKGFAPANLMLRDALELRDVDGDGSSTANDVEAAVRGKTHAGSYILHVLEPLALADAGSRAPARILEVEASGVHTRVPSKTKPLGETMLAATNHLRGKEGPQRCSRYERIQRTAKRAGHEVDRDALWDLGRSVRLDAVVHTMLVEPATRRLTLWLREAGQKPKSRVAPVVHDWDTLFDRDGVPTGT